MTINFIALTFDTMTCPFAYIFVEIRPNVSSLNEVTSTFYARMRKIMVLIENLFSQCSWYEWTDIT